MSHIRVLHLLNRLHTGGAEAWLMRVLREWDPEDGEWTFGVWHAEPGAYEEEALALGARIVRLNGKSRLALLWSLSRELARGRYSVVHTHVHHFSGLTLAVAKHSGVPIRIAHGHNDTRTLGTIGPTRKIYIQAMQWLLVRSMTAVIGCTAAAIDDLLGESAAITVSNSTIMPCGIDFSCPEASTVMPGVGRSRMTASEPVIGHVGRFVDQKNHSFLIDVFAAFRQLTGKGRLELVGEGDGMEAIREKVRTLGLTPQVTFLGRRSEVRRLMRDRFDLLMLPSLAEGFPVVSMEAQAEGLPIVISSLISPDVDIVPGLVHRVALAAPLDEWTSCMVHALQIRRSDLGLSYSEIREYFFAAGCVVSQNREVLARHYGVGRGMS